MPKTPASNEIPSLGKILKEGINNGQTPSLTVSSNSMSPLLRKGDRIGLQKIELDELNPGQIITFAYPEQPEDFITHRFAGTAQSGEKTKIITWADRTLMFDLPIEKNDIIGRVTWRLRKGRKIFMEHGRGAWISTRLYKLAKSELNYLTKLDLENTPLSQKALRDAEELRREGKTKTIVRVLRRFNNWWANFLVFLIDFAP